MYEYYTNCVNCRDVEALHEMIEIGQVMTKRDFWAIVGKDALKELFPFYKWNKSDDGISMWRDWSISYFKSYFQGKPCLYLVYSAIEYIFLDVEEHTYQFTVDFVGTGSDLYRAFRDGIDAFDLQQVRLEDCTYRLEE